MQQKKGQSKNATDDRCQMFTDRKISVGQSWSSVERLQMGKAAQSKTVQKAKISKIPKTPAMSTMQCKTNLRRMPHHRHACTCVVFLSSYHGSDP
jgi:hypothetical protein